MTGRYVVFVVRRMSGDGMQTILYPACSIRNMSISSYPPIKPQILEIGHTTDTCRRIMLFSSGPNLVIHMLHLRTFSSSSATQQCVWQARVGVHVARVRGVVTHLMKRGHLLYSLHAIACSEYSSSVVPGHVFTDCMDHGVILSGY